MKKDHKYHMEGGRIYLREVCPDDVNENYFRWMNDPEVTRHLEARFASQSMEDISRYVESMGE